MTLNSGLVVYNLLFRPYLTSRTNTNQIRELVKEYYDPMDHNPKMYKISKVDFDRYNLRDMCTGIGADFPTSYKEYKQMLRKNKVKNLRFIVKVKNPFSEMKEDITPIPMRITKRYWKRHAGKYAKIKSDLIFVCDEPQDQFEPIDDFLNRLHHVARRNRNKAEK